MHKRNGCILRAIFGSGEDRAIRSFRFWVADKRAPRIYVVIKAVLALGPR
jgi:hypothetical protein